VVAGGILVSMSLMAALWLSSTMDLWWTSTSQSYVREAAQQAATRMVSELRSATRTAAASPPNATIPAAPGNTTMDFYLPTDLDGNGLIIDAVGNTEWNLAAPLLNPTRVQYVYDAGSRQLQRRQGGQTVVLASGVTAAAFADRGIDGTLRTNEVRVSLTLQARTPNGRTVSASSSEIVKLRN